MTTYTIAGPEGKKYSIEGPPGASREDVIARIKAKIGGESKPPLVDPSKIVDDRLQMAEGMTHTKTAPFDQHFYPQDIDKAGLPFGQAADVLAGDNKAEREAALRGTQARNPERVQRRGEEGRRAAHENQVLSGGYAAQPENTLSSDIGGREYANLPGGKKVYVEPQGAGSLPMRMAEQTAARPGEITGGVVAGAAGAGVVGVGVAGGIGYLIDQAVKASRDRYHKTPGQLAIGAGESALMNAGGEAVARVPGAIMRGGLPEWLTGATPEKKEFAKTLIGRGAAPTYGSGAPGLATAEWKVNLAKKLGLPQTDARVHAVAGEIEDFLAKNGISDVEGTIKPTTTGGKVQVGGEAAYGEKLKAPLETKRNQLAGKVGSAESDMAAVEELNAKAKSRAAEKLAQVQQGHERAGIEAGRALEDQQKSAMGNARQGVQGAKASLTAEQKAAKLEFDKKIAVERTIRQAQYDQEMTVARAEADRALQTLRTGQGRPVNDLQATVAGDITAAKEAASKHFGVRYAMLDRLESGLTASMAPVSRVAKDILESIPRGADGLPLTGVTEQLAPKLQMLEQLSKSGDKELTVGEMAQIRSALYQLGGTRSLIPSSKQYLLGELYTAADKAVSAAVPTKGFGDGLLSPVEQAAKLEKIQKIRTNIEKDYSAYRKKFDDVLAQRLVKDAGTRGSVDAEDVISLAARSPNQFKRIWNIVTPDTQRRIGRGLFDDMIGRSTRGGVVDAQAFVDQLTNHSKLLREVFGKDAPRIIQAARGLMAVDGKIPVGKRLIPENVVAALESATKTQKEMDQYFSKHSLALMAKNDIAQDRAVQEGKLLLAKKKEEMANLAMGHTGEKRALEDKTFAEREAMRKRIADAGNKVSARGEARIELGREKVASAKKALQDFDQDTFGKMADPNFLKDNAVDFVIRPGQTELLKKAVGLYGPGSEQVRALQEAFFRKAVASGTRDLTDPKRAFGGEGIRDFLKQYTPEQKRILLETFGGEDGLQKISRFYDFAFPVSTADVSAGLAGGEAKSKMGPGMIFSAKGLGSLAKYGKSYFTGYLLSHPQVYKYLILGLDRGPKAEAALKAFDNGLRAYVQTSASQGKAMGSPPQQ